MKTKTRILRLALAALLFAAPIQALFAAPPQTGIRGQTLVYQPGFWVEVSPGLWVGDGGFSFGWSASFTVISAHSGRQVARVSSRTDGSFEVSLPPGEYVVIPEDSFALAATSGPFEVTVTAKHYADAFIYYESAPITVSPDPPR